LDTNKRFDNIRMIGGANAFCNTDYGEKRSKVSKVFSNLPGHYKVRIEYDVHILYVDNTPWSDEEKVRL